MFSSKLKGISQAIIPPILLVVLPTTFLGFLASGSHNWVLVIFALLITTILDIGANVINNYADWEIDIVNNKRTLMHQFLSKSELLLFYGLLVTLVVGLLLIFKFGVYLYLSVILFLLMGLIYSVGFKLKDRFPLNYAAIALSYGGLSFLIGFFAGTNSYSLFITWLPVVIFIVLVDFGYSMTKDYADVDGDSKHNKITLPVLFGKQKSLSIQLFVITIAYLVLAWLILSSRLNLIFIVLFACYLFAIYILYKVKETDSQTVLEQMHFYSQLNGLSVRFLIIILLFLTLR